jgi:hypothetical protein
MSNLPELPKDYWDKVDKQRKVLDKLRKRIQEKENAKQILLARRSR